MANILPNVEINFPGTPRLLAKLFFRTVLDSVRFKTTEDYNKVPLPLSFIYLDALYWEKGKPFLFNNELLKFSPAEVNCLDPKDFKQLYREILELGGFLKLDVPSVKKSLGDDMLDGFRFYTQVYALKISDLDHFKEKEIIDQLDIPALENSLNEALRIENYEAAAYIRNKIEALDHIIIEYKGRLKIQKNSKLKVQD